MKKYLECSRSPWYSLIFVLPLWLAYEALNAAYNFGQKRQILNGADAMLRTALAYVGLVNQNRVSVAAFGGPDPALAQVYVRYLGPQ